jgi:DNA-binding response OmpR family regulator
MLNKARVLIVEDEPDVAGLMKHSVEKIGAQASVVGSGDAAIKSVGEHLPDLILLDLNLPLINGLEVCRLLRLRPDTSRVPIIMVTARTAEEDRVLGLREGADDYICKPFSLRELSARVEAVLRRARGEARGSRYAGGDLVVDFEAVSIAVAGTPVRLTRREFELLRYLVQNRNRVVSRDRLLESVWGYDRDVETRSVDVHVGRLRTKLREAGRQIETVIGLGYRFID